MMVTITSCNPRAFLFICLAYNCLLFSSSFTPTSISKVLRRGQENYILGPSSSTTSTTAIFTEPSPRQEVSVLLEPKLTDERITSLFAWISRAFAGDDEYNNLMLAMAAIFGTNLPSNSMLVEMVNQANQMLPKNDKERMGTPIRRFEREEASLGAMGAGQWLGQYKTRPHALLSVNNVTHVDEWIKTLPRGCKRTLKKANAQNFTVTTKAIEGGKSAPHSSLAHFKCVVEHEVRLITGGMDDYYNGDNVEMFFSALSEAVSRYIGTTRMTGDIQEYKNENGEVIAFAHEVRKGKTIRGQWFYCTDEASTKYVWFHSVQELVRRAIDAEGVDTVDLGPSGSDAFSELKARYGFESVDDWPAVADYTGPFYYEGEDLSDFEDEEGGNLMDLLRRLGR